MPSSTPWLTELPAAFNDGWAYRDRITAPAQTSAYYAARYPHSDLEAWRQRLAAGQIWRNGQQLWADVTLLAGDRLVWHRPPWQEPAVPVLPSPLFDDGDLVVFNKPSGLPVLPAGGWLRHTVLGQLQVLVAAGALEAAAAVPRPVHRLGRFTSGLLVCARSAGARGWLSAQLRESTRAAAAMQRPGIHARHPCSKIYRTLLNPPLLGSPLLALAAGAAEVLIDTPIGRRPHARLGAIWSAGDPADPQSLLAQSQFRLLAQRPEGWLVEVAIATGRPHQIRIHAAAAGAPLLGDPLYLPGGLARPEALPGDGGYRLHAYLISLSRPDGSLLELHAPLPIALRVECSC
ncbi:MAG: RNA pseudouridine synthase [Cyanobacteria bacterium K_DeepCast_35m_m2_023]|nr:RNA pseudouridine synthase [Cyanobacteria bacterium K_DeepCast_35m_m2_023]